MVTFVSVRFLGASVQPKAKQRVGQGLELIKSPKLFDCAHRAQAKSAFAFDSASKSSSQIA
jgi:hypothetical protein